MSYVKVQAATPAAGTGALTTLASNALAAGATAGNLLVCAWVVQANATGPTLTGYTQLDPGTWVNTGNATIFAFGKIAAGGETTATPSWTGAGRVAVFLYEFSGNQASLTGIVEASPFATGSTANPTITAAGATTDGNELLIAFHGRISRSAYTAGTVTGGFTFDDDGLSADGTASTGAAATFTHKILSANETPSTQITIANIRQWVSGLLILKAASGGVNTPVALTATTTSTASVGRGVGKPLTVTAVSAPSLAKNVGKAFTVTAVSAVSLVASKAFLRTLTVTVASTATVTRRVGKNLTVTSTTAAVVTKAVSRSLSVGVTATATVAKRTAKTLTASAASTVSLVAQFVAGGVAMVTTLFFRQPSPGAAVQMGAPDNPDLAGAPAAATFAGTPDRTGFAPPTPRRN